MPEFLERLEDKPEHRVYKRLVPIVVEVLRERMTPIEVEAPEMPTDRPCGTAVPPPPVPQFFGRLTVTDDGWTMQEAGLYAHPEYGALCYERGAWFWYLPWSSEFPVMKFRMLTDARAVAQLETEAERG